MSTIEKAIEKLGRKPSGQAQYVAADESSVVVPGQKPGTIADLKAFQQWHLEIPQIQRDYINNEYRRIKRPILNNAFGKNAGDIEYANLVMVTSSVPGEGKSFTSASLALSISQELDYTVLLVDADVYKKSISRLFACENNKGLMDVLTGEVGDLNAVVVSTNIKGLKFLPAGTLHQNAPELLASKRMEGFLHEISRRHNDRLIIFDTPPLLATVEAQNLAKSMGQIVMIIEAGRTPRVVLREAVETLDKSKPILLILNKSLKIPGADTYGSYYYGPAE